MIVDDDLICIVILLSYDLLESYDLLVILHCHLLDPMYDDDMVVASS